MKRVENIENVHIAVRLIALALLVILFVTAWNFAQAKEPEKIDTKVETLDDGNILVSWNTIPNVENIRIQIGNDEPLIMEPSIMEMEFSNVQGEIVNITAMTPNGEVEILNRKVS